MYSTKKRKNQICFCHFPFISLRLAAMLIGLLVLLAFHSKSKLSNNGQRDWGRRSYLWSAWKLRPPNITSQGLTLEALWCLDMADSISVSSSPTPNRSQKTTDQLRQSLSSPLKGYSAHITLKQATFHLYSTTFHSFSFRYPLIWKVMWILKW